MSVEQPLYLQLAWAELDVQEFPGSEDNPRIISYHAHTDGGRSPDAISWCSSFMCAMTERAGGVSPHSKAAISWMNWGEACDLDYGVICVLWRGASPADWRSHVGIVVGWDAAGNVYLIGGNQSNRVRVSRYPLARVRGFRREVVRQT